MIAELTLGTEHDGDRRVWSPEERFVATSLQRATKISWERMVARGIRVLVDKTEAGTVMGWGFMREVERGPARDEWPLPRMREPFIYVCRPWLGTQVGEAIRDRLLRELGA